MACFIGVVLAVIASVLLSTPQPSDIRDCITAKMHEVRLCPADKSYTRFKGISPYIRHAVIVSEDSSFYDHSGLDFHELKKSFEENLKAGRFARGGSTITQQLAKNVYLSSEKSLFRKAREALLAVRIEKTLKKDEILEKYLNVVEFGPDIHGVEAATRFYFGKKPSDVSVLEGAWLAFVLPNPKKYSTSFRKRELTKFARSQLKIIVQRMARFGRIASHEEQEALDQLQNMFKPAADLEDEADSSELSDHEILDVLESNTDSEEDLPVDAPPEEIDDSSKSAIEVDSDES